jgi:hypothetical protein
MEAREALLVLKMGARDKDMGDDFLQGTKFDSLQEMEVAALFGPEFAKNLVVQDAGKLHGPLLSRYGLHLVRIEQPPSTNITKSTAEPGGRESDFNWEWRRALARESFEKSGWRCELAATKATSMKLGPP